jgi:hypothetical protein
MPTGPLRESKAIGGASKNFGADKSGKTPSQLWAERKARERGQSLESNVIPDIAPQSPLPRGKEPPVSPGTYVEDSAEVIGKPVSGGVKAMRERFARQSLDEDSSNLPISPGGSRPVGIRRSYESNSPPPPVSPPRHVSPPPVAVSSKPPPRTYQSLDDVVAAGAGAGVGLGVGALASRAAQEERTPSPPPAPSPPPPQETWDNAHEHVSEDEEDLAARHNSQIHAETYEPEAEPEPEHYEPESTSHVETGAESSKVAIVLFEYEAQEENEINLVEGQTITNIEFIDEVSSLQI